jgi:hypothetical protein
MASSAISTRSTVTSSAVATASFSIFSFVSPFAKVRLVESAKSCLPLNTAVTRASASLRCTRHTVRRVCSSLCEERFLVPLTIARTNKPGATREHTQLVLSDRSQLTKAADFAVVSPRTCDSPISNTNIYCSRRYRLGQPAKADGAGEPRQWPTHADFPDAKGGSRSAPA